MFRVSEHFGKKLKTEKVNYRELKISTCNIQTRRVVKQLAPCNESCPASILPPMLHPRFELGQFLVDFTDVEFFRIIATTYPFFYVGILWLLFFLQDFKFIIEAVNATAILWRTSQIAVCAYRTHFITLLFQNLFDLNGMQPIVTKILEIGKAESLFR